jgi:hypothetical protein
MDKRHKLRTTALLQHGLYLFWRNTRPHSVSILTGLARNVRQHPPHVKHTIDANNDLIPSSRRFTKQVSMPALPVPEIGKVRVFWSETRTIAEALVSSISQNLIKPTKGVDIAGNTRECTCLVRPQQHPGGRRKLTSNFHRQLSSHRRHVTMDTLEEKGGIKSTT